MTSERVTQLAQSNPTLNLSTRLGELKVQADTELANLSRTLEQIDQTREQLNEHGITMTVDLGDVGNAAAHARRAQIADARTDKFAIPKVA